MIRTLLFLCCLVSIVLARTPVHTLRGVNISLNIKNNEKNIHPHGHHHHDSNNDDHDNGKGVTEPQGLTEEDKIELCQSTYSDQCTTPCHTTKLDQCYVHTETNGIINCSCSLYPKPEPELCVLLLGGQETNYQYQYYDVSILPLFNPSQPILWESTCQKPPRLPFSVLTSYLSSSSGYYFTIVDGRVLACYRTSTTICYFLDPNRNVWVRISSTRKRQGSEAFATIGGGLYVAGGRGYVNGSYRLLSSSQILKNGIWSSSVELPVPTCEHCLASINENEMLLIGGSGNSKTWLLNWSTKTWKVVSTTTRYGQDCFVVNKEGAGQVMVRSGSSSYIFDVASGTWSNGARLGYELHVYYNRWVINNELTIFGGSEYNTTLRKFAPSEKIWKLQSYEQLDPHWIERAEVMEHPRRYHHVLEVPKSALAGC